MPPGDIVFSRNCGRPAGDGFVQLPGSLELGSAVFALPPSAAWEELRKSLIPDEETGGLPLVYAGDRRFPDGTSKLVVVQLSRRFTGDGGLRPGPVIWAEIHVIDRADVGKPKLLWRGREAIGTLQGGRVLRGQDDAKDPESFVVKIEEDADSAQPRHRSCRFQTGAGFAISMTEERDP